MDKEMKKRRNRRHPMVLEEEESMDLNNDIDEVEDEDVYYTEDGDEDINDESIDEKERGAHTVPVTIREPVVDGSIIQSIPSIKEDVDDNDDVDDEEDIDDANDDDDVDEEEEEEEMSHYKLHPESELVLLFLMSIPHLDEGWDIHELILVSYHFNCLCVWHHSLK